MSIGSSSTAGFKLDLDMIKKAQDKNGSNGFHDEFMSKIDEYSLSWREAALKEQRHK